MGSLSRALPKTFIALSLGAAACSSAPARPDVPREIVAPGEPSAREKAAGGDPSVAWRELTIESSYGPCPADGRSCSSKTHVYPDGRVVRDETQNPTEAERKANPDTPKVKSTTRNLDPKALERLDAVLRANDFRRDVRGHFACAKPAFDANLAFSIAYADGTANQDITTCVIDASTKPNLPNDVVEIVGRR